MPHASPPSLLRKHGLRNTQARRLVLETFAQVKRPASAREIHASILRRKSAIDRVTVYRVLSKLESLHVLHRHPCEGTYSLCTLPERGGHHGFLHCSRCGSVEEFVYSALCSQEDRIARAAGFMPADHVTEIVGTCHQCRS